MSDDPFLYDVARNRKTLETLAGTRFARGARPPPPVEKMFWESLLAT